MLKYTLFIIYLLISPTLTENLGEPDVFSIKRYMREKDIFRVNINTFLDMSSSSIDFTSNNPNILLPGIPDPEDNVSLENIKFSPYEFGSKNGHIFVLQDDKRTLYNLKLTEKSDYEEDAGFINDFVASDPNLRCNDLIVDQNFVFLLCYDHLDHQRKSEKVKYTLLGFDYFLKQIILNEEFKEIYMVNPKFKVLNLLSEDFFKNKQFFDFVLFDKQVNDLNFDLNKKIVILSMEYGIDDKENSILKINGQKQIILMNFLDIEDKKPLKLTNLIVNKERKLTFFVFKQDTVRVYIKKCENNEKEKSFNKCELFTKENVAHFFMKKDNYLLITNNKKLYFCQAFSDKKCKEGKIHNEWHIESILIEEDKAVVIMKIQTDYVMFINDYNLETFSWFINKEFPKEVFNFRLMKEITVIDTKYNLIYFYEEGFARRDITFNPFLEIKANNLRSLEPVEIFLDYKKIMNLELIYWDGVTITNIYGNRNYPVLKDQKDLYKLKLGFSGSNLEFKNDEFSKINYYNKLEIRIPQQNLHNGVGKFFTYGEYTYYFQENSVQILSCEFFNIDNIYECKEKETILFDKIPSERLEKIQLVGDWFFFEGLNDNQILVFDLTAKKMFSLEFPENVTDINNCEVHLNLIYCLTRDKEDIYDKLIFFTILDKKLILNESLSGDYIELIKSLIKKDKSNITEVKIAKFDSDAGDTNYINVLFDFISDGIYENRFIIFKISEKDGRSVLKLSNKNTKLYKHNPNINESTKMFILDSQTLFLTTEPKYSLFSYDFNSYFELESVSTNEVKGVTINKKANLFAVIYQSHLTHEYQYIIYKITNNAVKQVIKREIIENYNEKIKIHFINLDKTKIGIIIFNHENQKAINSNVFYEEGPILFSKDFNKEIQINKNSFAVNGLRDNSFHKTEFKYIKDEFYAFSDITTSEKLTLNEFLSFTGNLKDIQTDTNIQKRSLELKKPLNLDNKINLGTIKKNFFPLLEIKKNKILYETQKGSEYQLYDDKTQKIRKISFNIPENRSCQSIALSLNSAVCLYDKGSTSWIKLKDLNNNDSSFELFQLPSTGSDLKIIRDNNTYLTLSYIDANSSQIIIINTSRKVDHSINSNSYMISSNDEKIKILNKKNLQCNELHITSYDYFLDAASDMLTILIFDSVNNNVLVYHANINNLKYKKTLRRTLNLDYIDALTYKMKCKNGIDLLEFECQIHGSLKIYELMISYDENSDFVSNFVWSFRILHKVYNYFYDNSFDNGYDPINVSNNDYLAVADRNPFNNIYEIALYTYAISSSYTYYVKTLENISYLLNMDIIHENSKEYLRVFYLSSDLQIVIEVFSMEDYILDVKKPNEAIKKEFKIEPLFKDKGSKFSIEFNFKNKYNPDKNGEERKKGLLTFLIVAIVLVTLIILVLLLALVVLYRERKQVNTRATLINEGVDIDNNVNE